MLELNIFFQGKLKTRQCSHTLILFLQIATFAALKVPFATHHSKGAAKSPQNVCGEDFSIGQISLNQLYMRSIR